MIDLISSDDDDSILYLLSTPPPSPRAFQGVGIDNVNNGSGYSIRSRENPTPLSPLNLQPTQPGQSSNSAPLRRSNRACKK